MIRRLALVAALAAAAVGLSACWVPVPPPGPGDVHCMPYEHCP